MASVGSIIDRPALLLGLGATLARRRLHLWIALGREQECDYVCVRITESGDYWIATVEGPRG